MLKINDLCVSYKDEVLHHIYHSFAEEKLHIILGPNGSGKSTLLKVLAQINMEYQGEVIIDEKEAGLYKRDNLAKIISYLPQHRQISDISVFQFVLHGRFPHLSYPRIYSSADKQIASEALEKVGMGEYKNRQLSQLSGGQRQKVYIAMALAQDTKYLLLDEPIAALDFASQIEIMDLCKSLVAEGKTIIMVLHDIELAIRYGDSIMVVSDGNIVLDTNGLTKDDEKLLNEVFGVSIRFYNDSNGMHSYFIKNQ